MPTRLFVVAAAAMFLNGALLCVAQSMWPLAALRFFLSLPFRPRILPTLTLTRLSFAMPLAVGVLLGFLLTASRQKGPLFLFSGWWVIVIAATIVLPESQTLPLFLQPLPLALLIGVLGATLLLIPHWAQATCLLEEDRVGQPFLLLSFGALGMFFTVLGVPLVSGTYETLWGLIESKRGWVIAIGVACNLTLMHLLGCIRHIGKKLHTTREPASLSPSWYQRVRWTLLAAAPSAFFLAPQEIWDPLYSEEPYRTLLPSCWLASLALTFARMFLHSPASLIAAVVIQGAILLTLPTYWALRLHGDAGFSIGFVASWLAVVTLCLLPQRTTWLTQPLLTGLALFAFYDGMPAVSLIAPGAFWVQCRGCHGDMVSRPQPGWLREVILTLALGYLFAAILMVGLRLVGPINALHLQLFLICGLLVRVLPAREGSTVAPGGPTVPRLPSGQSPGFLGSPGDAR